MVIKVPKLGQSKLFKEPLSKSPKKRVSKLLKKEQRNLLLLHLMPHLDEDNLPNSVAKKSGMQGFWEDERSVTNSKLTVLQESGLLTQQKCASFSEE